MLKKFVPYIILFAAVLFSQCAQQTALSGGNKDVAPPMLDTNKQVIPANGTTNFSATRIVIPFNEYLQLQDKEKQILITPFLETSPDIYVKGKKIIIDFKAPLDDNTTYIINFGNSIVDITEGNKMVNYKYVFSTGSYIDSLTYSAAVYDAFLKTPVEGAFVMLYKKVEDSIILKEKPNYFGITNSAGVCSIGNIAKGDYKVVAFKEENSNYKWDTSKEVIGFEEELFIAGKDSLTDTLVVFSNLAEELKIEDVSIATSGKGIIVFNAPLKEGLDLINDSLVKTFAEIESVKLGTNRDTLFFYTKQELIPGEKYPVGINGTSRKQMIPKVVDSSISFKTNGARGLKPNEDLNFVFSQPIASIDAEKVILKKEDETIPFEVVSTDINQISIKSKWELDEDYEITLLPGAVISYRSISNDTITAYFETHHKNDFGQLITSLKVENGSYILELIKDGDVLYRDFPEGNEFGRSYADLFPGNYRIRLTFDDNKNKIWDTGDYFKHQQPERVEYYSEPIQIKKGWDMEINWEIK